MSFGKVISIFSRKTQISSSRGIKGPSHNLKYWEIMIKSGYYLALIPYKFEKKGSEWTQTTNWFQKKLCQLFMILHSLRLLELLKLALAPGSLGYFKQAEKLSAWVAQLIFIYSFWFKRHRFLDVFRHVSQESDQVKYFRERNNAVIPTLISIILVLGLAFGFDTLEYLFKSENWTGSHIYSMEVNAFKKFFNGIYIFKDHDKPQVQILIFLHSIVVALYKLYNAFCDLCPVYTALLFETLVSNNLQMLESEEDPLMVWSHYKNLKKLTEKINGAIGLPIFIYFIGSIPYFAEDLVVVVNGSTDTFDVVKSLYYLLSSFTLALVIAHSHHIQASATRAWIFREDVQCKLPDKKLQSIISEVCCEQESIGLSGAGMFTINYGFVGTAVPLVLTYAVLAFQFQLQAAGIDRKSLDCNN